MVAPRRASCREIHQSLIAENAIIQPRERAELASPIEFPPNRPQFGKEPLIDRALQIARAECPAGASGRRPDDPLYELYMFETPLRELLLVLQQCLGKEEEKARTGANVQLLERRLLPLEQSNEQLLQRRSRQIASDERWYGAVLFEGVHEMSIS